MQCVQFLTNELAAPVAVALCPPLQLKLPVSVHHLNLVVRTEIAQPELLVWMKPVDQFVHRMWAAWATKDVICRQEFVSHCVGEMMTVAVEKSVRVLSVLLDAEVTLDVLLTGLVSAANVLVSYYYFSLKN